jgi:dTDP-4-amino-4,6-dideoxygalactose transaminase
MPLYAEADRSPSPLPITESLTRTLVTLPISADMSKADADYVIGHLRVVVSEPASVRSAAMER